MANQNGFALLKWVTEGKVLGYRDLAGRESKPGTYDALSHMLFNVLPTPGSSGAPLVDEHGAVVGMALGTRMDNRVEGNRGWGVPAELIYEVMFGVDRPHTGLTQRSPIRCSPCLGSISRRNSERPFDKTSYKPIQTR
ncbi:hypothetical protein AG1IA_02684 [Rhizoctonia solani AG-1 IA]|uniref:Trypsin domain-containing protein n=1 Tax=Thanatephorus cucumeris (strain AG1-IA) TaxID=983506 RepID=L8X2R0_THACA|nr:hypothetical protein AG1IA_02684 [Rhizoctonia solani AG-1 IA]